MKKKIYFLEMQGTITKESIERLILKKHNPSLCDNGKHIFILFGNGYLIHSMGGYELFEKSIYAIGYPVTTYEIVSLPLSIDGKTYAILNKEDGKLIRDQMLRLVKIKDLPDDATISFSMERYYASIQDFYNGKKYSWLEKVEQKLLEREKYAFTLDEQEALRNLQEKKIKFNFTLENQETLKILLEKKSQYDSLALSEEEKSIVENYSLPYDRPQLD